MLLTGVILNIVLCMLWCGINYLVALGAAFGNQTSHNGVDIRAYFVVVIVATIAVCIGVLDRLANLFDPVTEVHLKAVTLFGCKEVVVGDDMTTPLRLV